MRKTVAMLAAVLMCLSLTGVLSGCTVEKGSSSGGEPSKEVGGDLKAISFYEPWLESDKSATGMAAKKYKQEYGGNIDCTIYPYELYNNKIIQLVAADNAPDIIFGYWGDMPKLAAIQVLAPVDEYLDVTKQNHQEIINTYTWGGKHYAATVTQVQTPLLWFNKKLMEKNGVEKNPYELYKAGTWTWTEFRELAMKLTLDTDGDGEVNIYGFSSNNVDVFHWSNSAEKVKINADETVEITWKSQACLNAYQILQSSRFTDKYYSPDPQLHTTGFNSGELAMAYGTFEFPLLFGNKLNKEDIGVAPFPTGPDFNGYYFGVSNFMGIARGAKNPYSAGKFCEMVCAMERENFETGYDFGNPDAMEYLTDEHLEVIKEVTKKTRVTLESGWGNWGYNVGNLLNLIFWDNKDIVTSLDEFEPVFRAEIDDTLSSKVPTVADFVPQSPIDFEEGMGYLLTEKAAYPSEIVEGDSAVSGKSLLLGGEFGPGELLAYTDPAKQAVPSFKSYKVSFDYKVVSADGRKASFALVARTLSSVDSDKEQTGWVDFGGAVGETGKFEGQIDLTANKSDFVFAIVGGINTGKIAIDNFQITEVKE